MAGKTPHPAVVLTPHQNTHTQMLWNSIGIIYGCLNVAVGYILINWNSDRLTWITTDVIGCIQSRILSKLQLFQG